MCITDGSFDSFVFYSWHKLELVIKWVCKKLITSFNLILMSLKDNFPSTKGVLVSTELYNKNPAELPYTYTY